MNLSYLDPLFRQFHGYAGDAPLFLGEKIHVDRFEDHDEHFITIMSSVGGGTARISQAELLALAVAINARFRGAP